MLNFATRPRFLNLLQIRMPVGAITSILHRATGLLIFLCIPLAIFLLDLSLQGPEGFTRAAEILASPLLRVIQIVIVWSIAHHMLAGIRFLLLDANIGLHKVQARASAWAVNLAAPSIAVILIWGLL